MTRIERNHQSAAAMLWCGTIVATAVLLSRRMAGEFTMPTSVWLAVFVSSCTAIVSLTAWALFQRTKNSVREVRVERLAAIVAWCPAWLSGLAVAPANSPFVQGWLIGVSLLSACVLTLLGRWDRATGLQMSAFEPLSQTLALESRGEGTGHSAASRARPALSSDLVESQFRIPDHDIAEPSLTVFDRLSEELSEGLVTQWMTRQTLPDGIEHLEGSVRACFLAGQRAVSIHVPFSPPFTAAPRVECEVIGDESARWKVSVVYPYGMRIELKRNESRDPNEIELAYSATCEQIQSGAA